MLDVVRTLLRADDNDDLVEMKINVRFPGEASTIQAAGAVSR